MDTLLIPTDSQQDVQARRRPSWTVAGGGPIRTRFSVPVNHDPRVVAARYRKQDGHAGRMEYGSIYRDGSCSCRRFKSGEACRHVKDWRRFMAYVNRSAAAALAALLKNRHTFDDACALIDHVERHGQGGA